MKRVALITGGSRGIGKEMVFTFLKAGYDVAFTYLNTTPKFMKELEKLKGSAKAYKADASSETDTLKLVKSVIKDFGRIDVLISNAGIFSTEQLLIDTSTLEYDELFAVNTKGNYLITREVTKEMIKQKNGRIISISSVLGVSGGSCNYIYTGTKAAIIGFTKSLAKELGPFGITVNAIAPGSIATDMTACYTEEEMEEVKNATPMRRIGKTSDIARAAIFLASTDADFITGQILGVDGGLTLN